MRLIFKYFNEHSQYVFMDPPPPQVNNGLILAFFYKGRI